MAPGPEPLYPQTGSLEEMTELYLDTIQKYAECEDQRATIVESIRELKKELGDE